MRLSDPKPWIFMSVFIFYGNIVECPSRVKPHDVHLYLECGFLWDSYSCTGSPCAGIWPARIFMESSAQPDPDDLRLYRENQKMCPVKKVSDTLKNSEHKIIPQYIITPIVLVYAPLRSGQNRGLPDLVSPSSSSDAQKS